MLCLELHGIRSGICTRFGCATASCTCSEKPLPWGLGGILSILKLVAVSEYSRDQRLSSRITVYRSAGRSELFDHMRASPSLSRTPSGTLSGNSLMVADVGTGLSLLTPQIWVAFAHWLLNQAVACLSLLQLQIPHCTFFHFWGSQFEHVSCQLASLQFCCT